SRLLAHASNTRSLSGSPNISDCCILRDTLLQGITAHWTISYGWLPATDLRISSPQCSSHRRAFFLVSPSESCTGSRPDSQNTLVPSAHGKTGHNPRSLSIGSDMERAPGGYYAPPPVRHPMGMPPVYAGQVNADLARATARLKEQRDALVKLPKDIGFLTTLLALIGTTILGVLRADTEIQKMERGALIRAMDYVSYGAILVNILGTAKAVLAHYRLSGIHTPEAIDPVELYKLDTGKTSALRLLALLGADRKLRFLCILLTGSTIVGMVLILVQIGLYVWLCAVGQQ
ncbi:hypothetical protein FB45DRAFT_1122227, partial [Roridomyces roridus]